MHHRPLWLEGCQELTFHLWGCSLAGMTVVLILDFLFISLSRAMCTHPVGIYLPSVWEGTLSPSEGTALLFGQRKMPICHDNTVTCHSGMPDLTRACWHSALEWVKLLCCSLTAHLFIVAHFLYHKTSSSFHQLAWVHSEWLWEQSGGPCRGKKKSCAISLHLIWFGLFLYLVLPHSHTVLHLSLLVLI